MNKEEEERQKRRGKIETCAHLIKNHCPLWYRPEESIV